MSFLSNRFTLTATAIAATALLAACGGGGSASAPAGATDTTPPTVTISDDISATTATGNVTFTFTFSEAVSGFTTDDVTVTGGTKGTFTMASNNLSATLVVVPTANSTGTINVSVAANAFVDLATNANTAGANGSQAYDTTTPTPTTTIATFDETPPATLIAFEGTAFTAASDNGSNVAQLDKPTTAQPWGGATFQTCPSNTVGNTPAIPFSNSAKKLSLKVKAPRAGVVFTIKAEGTGANAGAAVTAQATNTGTGWETLTFDFAQPTNSAALDISKVYNVISVFPNWSETDSTHPAESQNRTYYFDDLKLVGLSTTLGSCPAQPTAAPTTAPATPSAAPATVISIYSNAYTPTAGINLNPGWGQSTAVSEPTIAGNQVQKYANFNYQGIDFAANTINASSKTSLHVDFWSADATSVDVFIISLSPTLEQAYTVTLTPNQWTSVDIPLSSYTTPNKSAIGQIKLVANPSATTVYMDNLYFK